MSAMRCTDRIALDTCGGSGIGRAAATALAAEGALIVVAGRHEPALRETAQAITESRGRAQTALVDVTSDAETLRLVSGPSEPVAYSGSLMALARCGTDVWGNQRQ